MKPQKTKRLIDTFTKAQRDKVERVARIVLLNDRDDPHHSVSALIADYPKQHFSGKGPTGTPNGYLWWRLSRISSSVLYAGYVQRLLEDNLLPFRRALLSHGRMKYLCHLVRPHDRLQAHYLPWFDLIGSIAVRDDAVISAYGRAMPLFAPDPVEPSLAAMFLGLYQNGRGTSTEYRERLQASSWSPPEMYEEMRLALLALVDRNQAEFSCHVRKMAQAHRKQNAMAPFHDQLFRYVSIPAHAVYALGRQTFGELGDPPTDRGFDPLLIKETSEVSNGELLNFGDVSPAFQSWLENLPEKIDVQELIVVQ